MREKERKKKIIIQSYNILLTFVSIVLRTLLQHIFYFLSVTQTKLDTFFKISSMTDNIIHLNRNEWTNWCHFTINKSDTICCMYSSLENILHELCPLYYDVYIAKKKNQVFHHSRLLSVIIDKYWLYKQIERLVINFISYDVQYWLASHSMWSHWFKEKTPGSIACLLLKTRKGGKLRLRFSHSFN